MLQEIAAAVRAGRVSPLELVDEALARIDRLDGPINAVVALRVDGARDDARAMTAGRARPDGPLAGIPVLVKDLTRAKGLPTSFGSKLFADGPVESVDDIIVARLRAAGAIVIGKTNTPAFGHTGVTNNAVFGATNNPWNLTRSPGGSSGGSSAALAAALAPIATSTDGGGSVRGPASFTGMVGWKPTQGHIGRSSTPRWLNYSTSGAIGRSVADALLEGNVISGAAPGDVLSFPAGTVSAAPRRPKRIIAIRTLRNRLDPEVGAAFDSMVALLQDELGFPVEMRDRFTDIDINKAWMLTASVEIAQSLNDVHDRWDELDDGLAMQCRLGEKISAFDYIAGQRDRYAATCDLDLLLGDDTVLVTPTLNAVSLAPDTPITDLAGVMNTMDFNATGHPGVSVPMGTDPSGVPMGFQIVAPRFRDGLALGLAAAIEQAKPWATVAPGYDAWPVY
jgi:Asp-tRNA(Asn)/Glu-tRNA(Gln) amidotransferase A subunit family amidase